MNYKEIVKEVAEGKLEGLEQLRVMHDFQDRVKDVAEGKPEGLDQLRAMHDILLSGVMEEIEGAPLLILSPDKARLPQLSCTFCAEDV